MTPEVRSGIKTGLGFVLVLSVLSACTTRTVMAPGAAVVGPQLSVERFLQAANARDLETMGRIFGTAEGAALDTGSTLGCMFKKIGSWFGGTPCTTREEVEIRMDAIASVLRHEDFRIVREERVAGREHPTVRVLVDLTIEGRTVREVPFHVVQAPDGRWLIEFVDLEKAMQGG